ncbi:MAG: outer membrane beta-barrel protein, partial [Bacteroidota bacterium]
TDLGSRFTLDRKFSKPKRRLILKYNINHQETGSNGVLYSRYHFNIPALPDSIVDQTRETQSIQTAHSFTGTYVEPLTKKIRAELVYAFNTGNASQKRETFNRISDGTLVPDPRYSNEFDSKRTNNQVSGRFTYETNKVKYSLGTIARRNDALNHNLVTGNDIRQQVDNLLPFASLRYNFSESRQLTLTYNTSSEVPTIQQLQPVPDNTNPNFIQIGNPNLLPTFSNNLGFNYYSYSIISGRSMFAGGEYKLVNNAFSTSTSFDTLGRTLSAPVNVDGNRSGFVYLGGQIRISPNWSFNYNLNMNYFSQANYINQLRNRTTNQVYALNVGLSFDIKKLSGYLEISKDLNYTASTLNSSSRKPYGSNLVKGSASYQFPKGISLESSLAYTNNTRRAQGYNVDYLIWNAAVNKKFFKRENLILGVEATDLLNQNVSINRTVQANVIVDSRTSVIGRYVLLKATYKFDNKKEKTADETDY